MTHPENDLTSDYDYSNRARPDAESFDELADQPDPLEVAARNKASTRQAILYMVSSIVVTLAISGALALIFRLIGGPLCEAVEAVWLCSQSQRTWWAILSSIPPVAALIGCAVIMVRKLNRYERWMPWMGVLWLPLLPFTMWWLTITVGILATDFI